MNSAIFATTIQNDAAKKSRKKPRFMVFELADGRVERIPWHESRKPTDHEIREAMAEAEARAAHAAKVAADYAASPNDRYLPAAGAPSPKPMTKIGQPRPVRAPKTWVQNVAESAGKKLVDSGVIKPLPEEQMAWSKPNPEQVLAMANQYARTGGKPWSDKNLVPFTVDVKGQKVTRYLTPEDAEKVNAYAARSVPDPVSRAGVTQIVANANRMSDELLEGVTESKFVTSVGTAEADAIDKILPGYKKAVGAKGVTGHLAGMLSAIATAPIEAIADAAVVVGPGMSIEERARGVFNVLVNSGAVEAAAAVGAGKAMTKIGAKRAAKAAAEAVDATPAPPHRLRKIGEPIGADPVVPEQTKSKGASVLDEVLGESTALPENADPKALQIGDPENVGASQVQTATVSPDAPIRTVNNAEPDATVSTVQPDTVNSTPTSALQADTGTSTRQADIEDVREELGLDPRDTTPETIGQWAADAEKLAGQEVAIAKSVATKPRQLTKVEEIALGRKFYELKKARDAAMEAGDSTAYDAFDDDLQSLAKALDVSGSEWGRQGVARQIELASDTSEFGIRRRFERAAQRPLTKTEIEAAQSAADKIEELTAKIAELEARPAQTATRRTRAGIQERRKAASDRIEMKLRESAKKQLITNDPFGVASAAQTAQRLKDIAPEIIEIAKTYVDEGVVVLSEVAGKVRETLKGMGVEATGDEIMAVIGGKVKAPRDVEKTLTDWEKVKKQASDLFTQERERVNAEKRRVAAELKAAKKQERAKLQEDLRALADEDKARAKAEREFWREVETRKRQAKATERDEYKKWWRESVGGERALILNQMERLKERIATLTPEEIAKAKKKPRSPELNDLYIQRDAAARELRLKEQELKAQAQPKGVLTQIAGELKGALATGDFSWSALQGSLVGIANPRKWMRGLKTSMKASTLDKEAYGLMMEQYRQLDNWDKIVASGADLPGVFNSDISEFIPETVLDNVRGYGRLRRGSDQAFRAAATDTRINILDNWIRAAESSGRPLDSEALKVLGDAVNTFTGKASSKTGKAVSTTDIGNVLFAPGYYASQLEAISGKPLRDALGYGKRTGDWRPAKLMAAEYGKIVGLWSAALVGTSYALDAYAKYSGNESAESWRVERDPRSSLFGKAWKQDSDGNLVAVDFLPPQITFPLKMSFQMLGGKLGSDNTVSDSPYDRQRVLGSVLEGKSAPLPRNFINALDSIKATNDGGKKYPFDENTDPRTLEGARNLAVGAVTPLSWQQAAETIKASPLTPTEKALLTLTSFFGRGAQSYKADPIKRDARKLPFGLLD